MQRGTPTIQETGTRKRGIDARIMPTLPGPTLGPFAATLNPIIQVFLGLLMFAVLTYCLYHIVQGVAAWVSAHAKNQFGGMNAAEQHLFPPLIGFCGTLMLPALIPVIYTFFGF